MNAVLISVDIRDNPSRREYAKRAIEALTAHLGVEIDFDVHGVAATDIGGPAVVGNLVRPAPTCSVGSCNGSVKARGYCNMHYVRSRQGTPMDLPPLGYISAEKIATIERMIEDEASLNEISRTVHIDTGRIRKMYPQYAGWGKGYSERASAASKVAREMNKLGAYL